MCGGSNESGGGVRRWRCGTGVRVRKSKKVRLIVEVGPSSRVKALTMTYTAVKRDLEAKAVG